MSSSYNFEKVRNDRLNLSQVNAETLNTEGPVTVGTTEVAGATGSPGQIVYNTSTGKFQGSTGGAWFDIS